MAYIKQIWFHDGNMKDNTMRVTVALKPAGEVAVDVPVPPAFMDCLLKMAQHAADLHEQKMRAEILADNRVDLSPGSVNWGKTLVPEMVVINPRPDFMDTEDEADPDPCAGLDDPLNNLTNAARGELTQP